MTSRPHRSLLSSVHGMRGGAQDGSRIPCSRSRGSNQGGRTSLTLRHGMVEIVPNSRRHCSSTSCSPER